MKKLTMLLVMLLILTLLPIVPASAAKPKYESKLFDRSEPIVVNIIIDDATWDNMIATAEDEVYSACDVEINGKLYENVAIRPKGNSSLTSVQTRGSERFSWRIKFDKYEKKRTCDGLDVLILNNGFKDPGQLREAIAYDMYAFLDADASLYNYAIVYLNGEYFGCYLALECVDESFAERNYGENYGELYKPEIIGKNNKDEAAEGEAAEGEAAEGEAAADEDASSGDSAGGSSGDAAESDAATTPDPNAERPADGEAASSGDSAGTPSTDAEGEMPAAPEGDAATTPDPNAERPAEGEDASSGDSAGGSSGDAAGEAPAGDAAAAEEDDGSFGGSSGSSVKDNESLAMALNYVGDDLADYEGIWESAKFNSDEEDYEQVVEALKNICSGENIEDYLEVDNVLKYFAIQTFIYNHDGLTGTVTHNYYLYEKSGKLNLIPWDMNEAFTVSGDGSDYVNFPIDTPFTVTDLSERSFFMALLADEECLAKYHEYLRQLSEEYALGGAFEETMTSIRAMIDEYVKTDPTMFATYEEYEAAASSLTDAVTLRAQSVLGQLDGSIPSTREGQEAEPDKLLDTTGADFSGLGEGVGMGGGGGMPTMNFPGFGR